MGRLVDYRDSCGCGWRKRVGFLLAVSVASGAPAVADAVPAGGRTAHPTARIVLGKTDLPGYSGLGTIADLATPIYLRCFKRSPLLATAPRLGPAGTSIPTSNRSATVGESFHKGSVALAGVRDVASIAWSGESIAQARSALTALTGNRVIECIEAGLKQAALREEVSRGPVTVTAVPLVAPTIRPGAAGAVRLNLTVYDDVVGGLVIAQDYDFTTVRVGRMLALLETDAAPVAPVGHLSPPGRAQRLALTTTLADRMAAAQQLRRPTVDR